MSLDVQQPTAHAPGTNTGTRVDWAPVPRVNRVPIALLQGIERQRDILLDNTRRFADGLPANNALLWGARGMGKSSLVKSVHAAVNDERQGALALVEISNFGEFNAVVGYQRGDELAATLGAGFEPIGPLRVWIRHD